MFISEISDKIQFSTVALAVKYPSILAVVAGRTF
ncbi:MAG: hypothetical protein EXR88_03375 [Gammaproteobacteria bacterium]|nr:hypothetical protein [Gammaproteobacteria bacterium]